MLDPRDIDESVLQELPPHIRMELQAAMQQHAAHHRKKPIGKQSSKKGTPAITSFFKKK